MTKKVLVVEDNELNLELLTEVLGSQENWEISTAANGQEALEIAKRLNPDIILLDIQLPELDGFQVLKSLKEEEKTAQIPVIGVTAYAMKGDKEKILEAGFDGYISKPIQIKELLRTVKEAIRK